MHDDVTTDEQSWTRLDLRPLPHAERAADDVLVRRGAVYASPAGYRPLELDVYRPAGADPSTALPVVVWVHGGAFLMGARWLLPDFLDACSFFATVARAGFVVVSVDYRLSGEARWPTQVEDVRAALRWVRARADELGADPRAVAVWGESAGAHLSTMTAVLGADGTGADVSAVVHWYGPTDFSTMDAQAGTASAMSHDAPDSPESLLIGAPVPDAPELVAAASPLPRVHPDLPPFLVRHGTDDDVVAVGQSEQLVAALRAAGVPVDFARVTGAGHVFAGHPDPSTFVTEAVDFLTRTLAPAVRR